VAGFIANLDWRDVPPPVVERAKMCLVDTLGAMIAGRATRSTRIAADVAQAAWPGSAAHLVMNGASVSTAGAAFANAVAANAVDIDDCGIYTWGHPGAQVVPVALACAERQRLDGRALLTAIVVGYEIAFRAGRCLNHEAGRALSADRHYRACGSWGATACAAIASHALGLDARAASRALGIAEYHSPDLPMMRDIDAPAMVKHGVGIGALAGILSAELAGRGFTGIVSSLEEDRFAELVRGIGVEYLLPRGITWKRFCCCAWAHPALLAVERLVARDSIAPERIAHIVVETYPDAARLGTRLPTTTEEAQFNLAWPIAALLLDGQVGPEEVLEERLASPAHRDLCQRVEVRVSDELSRLYYLSEVNDPRGKDAAIVTMTLNDGEILTSGLVEHVLYPEPAWGRGEMQEKLRWLAAPHFDPDDFDEIAAQLWDIENVDDVGSLMRALTAALVPIEQARGERR
jgi:2-methylcitrate dehydratase PrpD